MPARGDGREDVGFVPPPPGAPWEPTRPTTRSVDYPQPASLFTCQPRAKKPTQNITESRALRFRADRRVSVAKPAMVGDFRRRVS